MARDPEEYWEDGKHQNHPQPNPVVRHERILEVWKYKRAGKSYAWIAETMGISPSTAHKYLKEGLMLQAPQAAEEERILLIQQLDELYSEGRDALDAIVDPLERLKAILVLDKLLKSRRELMGLDAPTKFQGVIHNVDAAELELSQIIEKEKARAREREAVLRAPGAAARARRSDAR